MMISVVEVIQAEGFTYSKRLAWAAGRAVSREWRQEHETAPQYAMRPKTLGSTGGGPAHMKAVYPAAWRGRISRIVAKYADEAPKPDRIPTGRSTVDHAMGLAAWSREVLTGQVQRLVWEVDLIRDVGTPDGLGDPDGYADKRWTTAIARLQEALQDPGSEAATQLVIIVTCYGTIDADTANARPSPHRIDLPVAQVIDIAVAQRRPPYGRWRLMTEREIEALIGVDPAGLPSSYFIDGLPF